MTSPAPQFDADRRLALTYVPTRARPAVEALWGLDVALGQVLSSGKEPLISQIKLAWWRESLEKLDSDPAPPEPVLQAVASAVLTHGVSGRELSAMVEGWETLLQPDILGPAELETYAAGRGGLLFRHSSVLLGATAGGEVLRAGESWALTDLARHSGNEPDAAAALSAARQRVGLQPVRWPSRLRPLGMLAVLARRDQERAPGEWEQPGAPPRMLRMLRHRLTGR